MCDIQFVEQQICDVVIFVVAADAVLIENLSLCRGIRKGLGLRSLRCWRGLWARRASLASLGRCAGNKQGQGDNAAGCKNFGVHKFTP
jgi:hypothetical protein